MKISELHDGMNYVYLEAEVVAMEDIRQVKRKDNTSANVMDVLLRDDSGATIKASLWNDQIQLAGLGIGLKFSKAYTRSFRGELRLETGQSGKVEAI